MKNISFFTLAFLLFSSCCTYNLSKEKQYFVEIHQKVYQEDVELLFRVYLFFYGRFPINISEITDSVKDDPNPMEWFSIKMSDPFSHNNKPFKYLSFNDGKSFLLISRGPDHRFNHYNSKSSLTSIINSPLLLADFECTDTTNYCDKDIIVLCSEAKSMFLTNSKIMDDASLYFDQMIAQNKRYTYGYKNVLFYVEPVMHRKLIRKVDGTNSYIDIEYKGYVFKFLLSADMNNNVAAIVDKVDKNFSISGVYNSYDKEAKLFTYKHCIFEELIQPQEIRNINLEKRQGSAFNINRCDFSLDSLNQK